MTTDTANQTSTTVAIDRIYGLVLADEFDLAADLLRYLDEVDVHTVGDLVATTTEQDLLAAHVTDEEIVVLRNCLNDLGNRYPSVPPIYLQLAISQRGTF